MPCILTTNQHTFEDVWSTGRWHHFSIHFNAIDLSFSEGLKSTGTVFAANQEVMMISHYTPSINVNRIHCLKVSGNQAPLPSHFSESLVRKSPTDDGMNNVLNNRPSAVAQPKLIKLIVSNHARIRTSICGLISNCFFQDTVPEDSEEE